MKKYFMNGYKSYLVAALMVIAGGLLQQGYIDDTMFKAVEAVLIGAGIMALRHGMVKKY